MRAYPTLGLRVLLTALLLAGVLTWLPVVRGISQPEYQWAFFGLGGRGQSGHYPIIVAIAALTWVLQYLGWRRPLRPWLHAGLIAWFGTTAVVFGWYTWRFGDQLMFRGDTLGVAFSLGWIPTVVAIALLLVALTWVVRDVRRKPGFVTGAESADAATFPTWSRRSRYLALAALSMFPVQIAGFGFGELHGVGNKVAVMATIAQALLAGLALRTTRGEASGHRRPTAPAALA